MWRRRGLVAACVAGTVAALASAPTTASAALPAECVQPIADGLVTCTFTVAGEHELTLPAGVSSITVTAIGGRGGDALEVADEVDYRLVTSGGRGAVVSATIPVTAPSVFAYVGGPGGQSDETTDPPAATTTPGGVNGGGLGGGHNFEFDPSLLGYAQGGGGGASDVRIGDRDLQSRQIVAAGGGGAANGRGGDAGSAGEGQRGYAGEPGTASAGGDGGLPSPGSDEEATSGVLGSGGNSNSRRSLSGGGGGGGLYGGGGGSVFAGGGGSSLDPDGPGPTLADHDTPPSVIITFTPSPTPPTPPCTGSICLTPGSFGSS